MNITNMRLLSSHRIKERRDAHGLRLEQSGIANLLDDVKSDLVAQIQLIEKNPHADIAVAVHDNLASTVEGIDAYIAKMFGVTA